MRTLANGLRSSSSGSHEQPVGHRAPADARRRAPRIRRTSQASRRSWRRCSIRARPRAAPSRLPTRSTTSAARWATGAGTDLSYVNVVVMKDSFDPALDLLSDVARNPAFAPEELDRQKRAGAVQGLQGQLRGSGLRGEPGGRAAGLRLPSLRPAGQRARRSRSRASRATTSLAFHQHVLRARTTASWPSSATSTTRRGDRRRRARVRDWPKHDVPAGDAASIRRSRRGASSWSTDPNAVQTEIRVGQLGDSAQSSRLSAAEPGGEDPRRRRRQPPAGRAALRARADLRRVGGHGRLSSAPASIVAETDTRTETTAEALRAGGRRVLPHSARARWASGELSAAQAYLAGNFPLTIETPDAIALQVLNALFYELDLKELQTYRERVTAVTPEDIQRVRAHVPQTGAAVDGAGRRRLEVREGSEGRRLRERGAREARGLDLTTVDFEVRSTTRRARACGRGPAAAASSAGSACSH